MRFPACNICITSSPTCQSCTWCKHLLPAVINKHISTLFTSSFTLAACLTTCSSQISLFAVASLLLPRSQRSVLTVSCHPSGLSSVAPGRLARTAWDSAHFPALIIPACSAGTGPSHSGLRRPLSHLLHLLLIFFFFLHSDSIIELPHFLLISSPLHFPGL